MIYKENKVNHKRKMLNGVAFSIMLVTSFSLLNPEVIAKESVHSNSIVTTKTSDTTPIKSLITDKVIDEKNSTGVLEKPEKEKSEAIVKQEDKKEVLKRTNQEKTDQTMIKASNEIEGVKIDQEKFEESEKFSLSKLNPFHWVFKPVTDMQKRVVHLEKQIMRLEAPIANLQKPMVGLRQDMVTVHSNMKDLDSGMGQVTGKMKTVNKQMKSVDNRMGHVEQQLDQMYEPVSQLQAPVTNVSDRLKYLKKDLKELKDVVSLTSTLILIAVVSVGLLVAVGTPIAALFAWRHRRFIIEKLGSGKIRRCRNGRK